MIGTKLAHYEITAHLGSGGMGEVYQATDSKLGRSVAIKFLPEAFAHDSERVSRFQREARVLASLNHPNIAAIHGVEESGDRIFLVMELAAGETLAERIGRGALPMDEALAIAKQIAQGLEAAHEKGVIHRDLKPANIKVTAEGLVKVLDFGLAKADAVAATDVSLSSSPTMAVAGTNAGMILGTAAYMSPEQARGLALDRRTDIASFGAVLYEMLTGRQAFAGQTAGDILAAVIRGEPDWNRLPPDTPPAIRRLLGRCLQKDPRARFHDIADVRLEIEDAGTAPDGEKMTAALPRRGSKLLWLLVAVLAFTVAAQTVWLGLRPAATSSQMWVEVTTPPTTDQAFALSPDGHRIVFIASSEGRQRLWLRQLDSGNSRVLPGTDDGSFPFWSEDNRSVGFFADGKLKRIDIDGGLVRSIANAAVGRGGSWAADGTIVFAPTAISAIFSVSAMGGDPVAVTQLEANANTNHTFPWFLPDGRHFLYYATGTRETRGVYVGQIDGSSGKRLLDTDSAAVYSTSGHILFVRQGTLFAQPFDPSSLALSGNPLAVSEQMVNGRISVSAAGPIAFRTGIAAVQRQFVWFDRSGAESERIAEPVGGGMRNPSLSPDGRRLVVDRNNDIFLLELGRGVFNRFTLEPTSDVFPMWFRDGSRIVWDSNRMGAFDLYAKAANGAGTEELLYASNQTKAALDFSPDGRFLLYRGSDPNRTYDIWAFPMDRQQKPFPVIQTDFEERDAQFSPDGKWIAYQSNATGRSEIYIQRFSESGQMATGKWPVSSEGGAQVRWNPSGGELFYIGLDARLMAVAVRLSDEAVEVGAAAPLFITNVGGAVQGINRQQYCVSSDGKRFLMNVITDQTTPAITLLLNWKPAAK